MPRILVIYGTTTGHTGKIARALGDTLRTLGHDVDVVDAADGDVEPASYAGVIVAASVRGGKYQASVRRWVHRHARALNQRPSAFVSVCLAALQQEPEVRKRRDEIVVTFCGATGWWPWTVKSVAGALLYTKYNPVMRWIMKRIVAKAGGDTDTSRDYEYTDWADLRVFARQFERLVAGGAYDRRAVAS